VDRSETNVPKPTPPNSAIPSPDAALSRRRLVGAIGAGAAATMITGAMGASATPAQAAECEPLPPPLTPTEVRDNLRKLYSTLEVDARLREEFVRNPTGVLANHALLYPISDQAASASNRLLFAMLNNPAFLEWVGSYAMEHAGQPVDPNTAATDLARAILEHAHPDLLAALADFAVHSEAIPGAGFGPISYQLVYNNAAGQAVVTPVSEAQDAKSSQNFNQSSAGYGFSLGGSDIINPTFMRFVIDQMIDRARQLSAEGRLADIGQVIM